METDGGVDDEENVRTLARKWMPAPMKLFAFIVHRCNTGTRLTNFSIFNKYFNKYLLIRFREINNRYMLLKVLGII